MKKTAVILLLIICSSATMGATIHMHYCMNEFVGWSLWHGKKDGECAKCGMKEKKSICCKDKHKQAKVKTEHPKRATAFHIHLTDAPALVTPFTCFNSGEISPLLNFPLSNAPPVIPIKRLYILHSVFLI